MIQYLALAFGLVICAPSFAQQKTTTIAKSNSPAQKSAANQHKSCVGGFMRDNRSQPIEGVEAFIYAADSSIIASGYSDATGYYETNSVFPGKYTVKIVYPNTKTLLVSGVIIKAGVTDISLKSDPPAADTALQYIVFQPKPVEKPKHKKK